MLLLFLASMALAGPADEDVPDSVKQAREMNQRLEQALKHLQQVPAEPTPSDSKTDAPDPDNHNGYAADVSTTPKR